MAKKMILQVTGSPIKRDVEGCNLGEVMRNYDISSTYSAFVNNKPIAKNEVDGFQLTDGDMLIFTPSVKGNAWEGLESVDDSGAFYPYTVFTSPVLNIICIGEDQYKVNGLLLSTNHLIELYDSLEGEINFQN